MARRVLLFIAISAAPAAAQQRPCDAPTPLGPSHDLYCIELVAAPGATGVSGRIELARPAGPFTVAVTAAGRSQVIPIASLQGLPAAATFIAWATPPQMDTVIKLGEVRNGETALRAVDLDKFLLLITAERDRRVREPRGRVVLRGQSPSTRLFPPDLLEFSIGAMGQSPDMGHHAHSDSGTPRDSLDWPMVPMPRGLTMLPAELALRPQVSPYWPVGTPPAARPREWLRLHDGDTLRLEAGLVRRNLNGQRYTMYGFNGQYPGPLIEVARGSEIVVAFSNHLPESTTVHWHGVRLDNRFDGAADLTQAAVSPGGTFTYRVRFPDAGIYWYHPHVREDVQQELGLYGNLFLVNGEPDYRLAVRRGEVTRFFLTNASNTRTMNLSFPGARMKVVAADAGPFERETWVESVVIAPAERYVVHVRFDRPGRVALVNRVRGIDHLFGRFVAEVDTLGTVDVAAEQVREDLSASFATLRRDTATARQLEPYREFLQRPADKSLILTLETRGLPPVTQRLLQLDSIYFAPVEWSGTMPMMNWASTGRQVRWVLRDPATGRENMDIDWRFQRGTPVKLRLVNERLSFHGMQHPIHVHGQRFLVLAVNGVASDDLVWKDTVLVPAGSVVDILLDPSNPGRWMLHCHIAEHLSAGMMLAFTVE